jgi:hypothetical protein
MARRGCLRPVLLGMLSMGALLVAMVAAMNAIGCCAIDCGRFPEQCAANRQRQQTASLVLLGALAVSAGAMASAVYVWRRDRREG